MANKKYRGVSRDKQGRIYYQTEFKANNITGKRQAKKAGVEVITGKGLRHSHDSFLINVLGKDVLYVSKRSGRVDKATTLNTYSHLYDSKKASGGREISQALHKFGVSSNPTKTPLN